MAHLRITILNFDIYSHHLQAGIFEHLDVRANVIIEKDGVSTKATTRLKETPGGTFVPGDIEIGLPEGYGGPLSYRLFREEIANAYYRAIESTFKYTPEAKDFGLEQFTLALNPPYVFEMETEG